jgi:pterin-4a-carbinolamine dehydratase
MISKWIRNQRCRPQPGKPSADQLAMYRRMVPGWKVVGHRIERRYTHASAEAAMRLAIEIGKLALRQKHLPELAVDRRGVAVKLTTSGVGLTLNDYIIAARIDWLAGFR